VDILTLSRSRSRLETAQTRLRNHFTLSDTGNESLFFWTSKPHTLQSFHGAYPQIWRVSVDSRSFVPASLWTDSPWYNFQVSQFTGKHLAFLWHRPFFWAVTITVYHSGSYKSQSRTIMGARESLPSAVDLFGGVSRDAWRHSKHFKQPLDSLSSAFYFESCILKGFRLCTFVLFRSSVWTLDFGLDLFSSGWIPEGKHNSH
jgi:hypothetical protein